MHTVYFRDDARWNDERDCVEVTAVVRDGGREHPIACAITREALESKVATTARLDPLRLFRDFEKQMETLAAQKATRLPPEIAITLRDMKR